MCSSGSACDNGRGPDRRYQTDFNAFYQVRQRQIEVRLFCPSKKSRGNHSPGTRLCMPLPGVEVLRQRRASRLIGPARHRLIRAEERRPPLPPPGIVEAQLARVEICMHFGKWYVAFSTLRRQAPVGDFRRRIESPGDARKMLDLVLGDRKIAEPLRLKFNRARMEEARLSETVHPTAVDVHRLTCE